MKRIEIIPLLPEIFQRTIRAGTPLDSLLDIMEQMHLPSEQVLDKLEQFFNPYLTPDKFVPFLATWVDLAELIRVAPEFFEMDAPPPLPSGVGRLRELVALAAYFSQWRGTRQGLLRFLETATGMRGFQIDETVADNQGQVIPFHIRIVAPLTTQPFRPMLQQIIEMEKPAYVTYELQFR